MRRAMLHWILLFGLATTVAIGCGGADSQSLDGSAESLAVPAAEPDAFAGEVFNQATGSRAFEPTLTERLIIRNASLELVVQDAEAAAEQVNHLVGELGGFVVSSQMNTFDEGVRANLTVRVPAESLDSALAQLRDLALEVRRQTTSSQEVTEEYTDLQAQLRHLEATEARLLTFLDQAEDTEATLSVFSELRQVQSELERVKGRIQFLQDAAALSTISVELIPDALAGPISVGGWRPQGTLRNAVESLVRGLQFLVDAAIWLVVFVLPIALVLFALPGLVLLWVMRRVRRRRKEQNTE